MSNRTSASRPRDPSAHDLLDRLLASWDAGAPIPIGTLLPPDARASVVADVACEEVVLRLEAQEAVTLGEYLVRYPELAASEELARFVLETEIDARRLFQQDPPPTLEEYVARFPALHDVIGHIFAPPRPLLPASPPGLELLDVIGQGGMGTVYRARELSLDREVAVKVLHANLADEAGFARRFLREAQVTGQLQHPGIPPVFKVGTLPDPDGRPFLAMKLIKGESLDVLLDATAPVDTLGVFEAVCQAIGYAHERGVLHRDLKPANVMVGAFGEVQVMDWGLAKLVAELSPADTTVAHRTTKPRTRIRSSNEALTEGDDTPGTPCYMAPEQAGGENERIDARTDVFGLGGLLCVLLTGHPPIAGDTGKAARLNAMRGKTDAAFARLDASSADPELVTLCKRCLAFEPSNRPADGSAVAKEVAQLRLAADERARRAEVDREKVAVRAEEERKQLGMEARLTADKLAIERKRRRALFVATVAIVSVLVAGVAVSLWQAIRATEAEGRAIDERDAKDIALREAAALAVSEHQAKGREAHERKKAVELAAKETAAREKVTAQLGQIRRGFELTFSIFENCDIRSARRGSVPLEQLLAERIAGVADRVTAKDLGGDELEVARLQNRLGLTLLSLGESKAAVRNFEKALAVVEMKQGPNGRDTLKGMNNLAMAYHDAGRLDLAMPLYVDTVRRMAATLGPGHRDTLRSMGNLAGGHLDSNRLDLALPLLEQAVRLARGANDPDHDRLGDMNNLAVGYMTANRHKEALPLLEETLELSRNQLPHDHPDTLSTMNNLAECLRATDDLGKALPLLEETLERRTARLSADHPDTLLSMNNLAMGYRAAGRFGQAIPLLKKCLELKRKKHGPDNLDTLTTWGNYGHSLCLAGEGAKGAAELKAFVREYGKKLPLGDAAHSRLVGEVVMYLFACKEFGAAEEILRELHSIRKKVTPEDWSTFNIQSILGAALLAQSKYSDAEVLLTSGYDGLIARVSSIPPKRIVFISESLDRLIALYLATNKPAQVKKYRELRAKYPLELAPRPRCLLELAPPPKPAK